MLVRLTLCAALLAALGGCASYDSRYYRDDVVYEDGSYYAPAADGEGDYYYAPEEYAYDYGGWSDWGYGPAYPAYFLLGPGYGVSGFDGYCSAAFPACLPWWSGGYIDPHYRYWFGLGWGTGGWPYRSHDRGWYGDRDRDRDWDEGRDRWQRDHSHDQDWQRPPSAPSPTDVRRRPVPDLGGPSPVERMPRPVFDDKPRVRPPRPEPPVRVPRPTSLPGGDGPAPALDDEAPAPGLRGRERRTGTFPARPIPAEDRTRLPDPPPVAPRPVPPDPPAPASREPARAPAPADHRAVRRKPDRPPG